MLWRLMIWTCCSGLSPAAVGGLSSFWGKASASESRVATSALFGLLRGFRFVIEDFVTFDISCACLMRRLSFFEVGNNNSGFALTGSEDFFSIDLRGFAGWTKGLRVGAYGRNQQRTNVQKNTYHTDSSCNNGCTRRIVKSWRSFP